MTFVMLWLRKSQLRRRKPRTSVVGPGTLNGFEGSVALSLLMIPTVVKTTEEMLKIVPNDLREASLALGVTKQRTITKVVLRTALSGIVSGSMFRRL